MSSFSGQVYAAPFAQNRNKLCGQVVASKLSNPRAHSLRCDVSRRAQRIPLTTASQHSRNCGPRLGLFGRSLNSSAVVAAGEQAFGYTAINPLQYDAWDDEEEVSHAVERITDPDVERPDFDDPDWADKVTNWWDFWNHEAWDQAVQGLDDQEDAERPHESGYERAHKLINAIDDVTLRADVTNWLPPHVERNHDDFWEIPPVAPEAEDPSPPQNLSDVRAIAEKRRRREIMDAEWRRRQAHLNRFDYHYPTVYNDLRLTKFADEHAKPSWTWTDEEVMNLITNGGINCHPDDHGANVENPLLPIDYVNHAGVKHIPETEEFLESIGHYASPEMMKRFSEEIVLEDSIIENEDEEPLVDEEDNIEDPIYEEDDVVPGGDDEDDFAGLGGTDGTGGGDFS